jgi:hypothetical protein
MEELKLFNEFTSVFPGRQLEVIYMAQNESSKTTDSIARKFKLKGHFMNLNNNETNIYNIALNFNALPAHFIINSQGLLVTKSLPSFNIGGRLNPGLISYFKSVLRR